MNVQYPNYENWPPHFLSCCLKASGGIYFLLQTRPSFLIGKKIKKCFEYRKSRQAARGHAAGRQSVRDFPVGFMTEKRIGIPRIWYEQRQKRTWSYRQSPFRWLYLSTPSPSALPTVRRESKYRWDWCSWSSWSAAASSVCLCWSAAFLKTWYPLADNGDQRHLVFESRQGLYNDPAKITVLIRILQWSDQFWF